MNISSTATSTFTKLVRRGLFSCVLGLFLAACEAPLNLEQVAMESDRNLHRYDMLQAAAHVGDRVA